MAPADRRVEGALPASIPPGGRDDQAAVRDRRDLPVDQGAGHRRDRRRAASDVGRPVLPDHAAPHLGHVRRIGRDGIRVPGRDRGADGTAGRPGLCDRRGRRAPDDDADLASAVEWGLPIKIYIINNKSLGMVRQWQQLFYRERYSHVWLRNPDFAKLAEAFGAVGITARRPEEVVPAIEQSLQVTDRPCLVDFHCDPEENCYPMIPSGQSIKEMIVERG